MINSVRWSDKAIRVFDLTTQQDKSYAPIDAPVGALPAKLQHTAQ
jgi:hypothetical protein